MGAVQNYVTVSRRPPDVEDYIDMLRRHRSWIIGPTYAGLVIAVVVAFFWPDTFESSAILRVTPQMVSERVVPDTMDVQMAQLLDSLRTKILSRTYLTTLINADQLKLYPRLVQKYTLEDAIAQMQKDVTISTIASAAAITGRGQAAISVKFKYPDRYKAKKVVESLVSEFVNQNVTVQSDSARETRTFLTDQLKDAQEKLTTIETNITKFRAENAGRLPGDAVYNAQNLASLEGRASAADETVNNLQMERRNMENTLQSNEDMLGFFTQSGAQQSAPAQERANQNLENLDRQIEAEKAKLAGMLIIEKDTFPDVKREKAEIANLESQREQVAKEDEQTRQAQLVQQAAAKPDITKTSLSVQQAATLKQQEDRIAGIKTQMDNVDREIQRTIDSKAALEKQIEAVRTKIENSPQIEQQYSALTQDQMLAKTTYDDLSRKEKESETTQRLQEQHLGEQLEVLDPASLPVNPVEPNRWEISIIGVVMGMMIGLVLAGAKEAKDTSLKNLKDVRAYTNLPVLSSIPLLENALLLRRKRRLFWLAWSTAIIVGSVAMFIAMTYYMTGSKGQ
jgi:polysaccharide chain length determinant protein (PEP-CTERM system associated)